MAPEQLNHRDVIESPDPRMRATYIRVIIVEIVVLLALWALSSAFSG